jgi:hypothetical protein
MRASRTGRVGMGSPLWAGYIMNGFGAKELAKPHGRCLPSDVIAPPIAAPSKPEASDGH